MKVLTQKSPTALKMEMSMANFLLSQKRDWFHPRSFLELENMIFFQLRSNLWISYILWWLLYSDLSSLITSSLFSKWPRDPTAGEYRFIFLFSPVTSVIYAEYSMRRLLFLSSIKHMEYTNIDVKCFKLPQFRTKPVHASVMGCNL